MCLIARKPVFGVSEKVKPKPACSATETSSKFRYDTFQRANNNGIDQTMWMGKMVCTLVVCMDAQAGLRLYCSQTPKAGFLTHFIIYYLILSSGVTQWTLDGSLYISRGQRFEMIHSFPYYFFFFVLANRGDSDEMLHSAAFHLDLHRLSMYLFSG